MQEKNEKNLISPSAADKLIRAHDGDVALLCLYYLRSKNTDPEMAAAELCRTMSEINAAEEKLSRLGIMDEVLAGSRRKPAEPEHELPQYSARDIARRSKDDDNFSLILSEGEKVMGRKLNSNDMKVLFGIYDYLALPTEVILVMLNHCAAVCTEKYGESRRPSAGFIEKEAYQWAHREIMSLEQADEYIEFCRERNDRLTRIKRILNIFDRDFTTAERKDVSAWLDMGFGEEAIQEAYERTINHAGALRWNYMRKIILNWNEHGIYTPEDIALKDPARSGGTAPAPARTEAKPLTGSIIDQI